MNGSKRVIVMALAAVSAAVFVLGAWVYSGSGIPSWVVWEDSVFFDAAGMYEIELSHRTVSVK
ncbi:MAG: hypothetical protein K2G51_05170, partial [Lachnospiraceae bacterium]|nr:hypothetical protein [Lachnospiraceae bacterium]